LINNALPIIIEMMECGAFAGGTQARKLVVYLPDNLQ